MCFSVLNCLPPKETIPAASCPRCWSACRPRAVSVAAVRLQTAGAEDRAARVQARARDLLSSNERIHRRSEDLQRQANALIKADATRLKVEFIDVFTPMLDAQGQPREELFLPDRLHMNAAGYEVWKQAVRPYLDSDVKP